MMRPDPAALAEGVRQGHVPTLARAITLVESTLPRHRPDAHALLTALMPYTGGAHRVGITGVPGVGKSTFIEALGTHLTSLGHRVAVLAIDPSSSRTGGSILGDKTRMDRLARDPRAFIRPSPTGGTLGGVAARTQEALLLCEAAGFDVILVETVGVGQSELVVADLTDVALVLMLPNAGDELQGIKRGLMEAADVIAINKADGDNAPQAQRAAATYTSALRYLHPHDAPWTPPVLTCSALHGDGIPQVWDTLRQHRDTLQSLHLWEERRRHQQLRWLQRLLDERLRDAFLQNPHVQRLLPHIQAQVQSAALAPTTAAERLLDAFLSPPP